MVVAKEKYASRHAVMTKKKGVAVAKTKDKSIDWVFSPRLIVICAEQDDGMIAGCRMCSGEGVCLMME